jgi:hypothetical protein
MANENIEDDNADPKESESKNPDSPSGPQCIGNNPRPKGKEDSTDLPGGLGAAQDLFDQLTGGQSTLDPETGTLIGDNKTQLRPQGSAEDPRPRVDVPANVGTSGKHETIHFND